MKTAYIVSGFGETRKSYEKIIRVFQKKGIKTIFVHINWKHKTMNDYVQQYVAQVKNPDYVLGFSFGALIAITATQVKPKNMMLCSLSCWFKEDHAYVPKSWYRYIGKRRLAELKKISFNKIAPSIKCQTDIFVGKKEDKALIRRATQASRRIKKSSLIIIEDATHDITHKNYLKTVLRKIDTLKT